MGPGERQGEIPETKWEGRANAKAEVVTNFETTVWGKCLSTLPHVYALVQSRPVWAGSEVDNLRSLHSPSIAIGKSPWVSLCSDVPEQPDVTDAGGSSRRRDESCHA